MASRWDAPPSQTYRLSAGNYEVQVGRVERPSRIHLAGISAGTKTEILVDPNFEADLTTEGYAIVEAPPGQSAETIAVQVGSGIATLVNTRYALVFSVEGSDPLLLYGGDGRC